ncbi:MAG: hypothetical protein KA447_14115 [Pyrinomonadaceae bacterium]|nr:hypothetical protein [Pyrinomonadaceae bacterium]
MWEETDFVGNMIKLNTGLSLYTSPADSNSMIYNPLSFLATYAIAWTIGETRSIAILRSIQLGYVTLAAAFATQCTRMLYGLANPRNKIRFSTTWMVLTFLSMFLLATAPFVNKFVLSLHVDALSLLISVFSFWAMLKYGQSPTARNLVVLALCPAIGFLTKQFLISWAAVIVVFLIFLDPKNIKRAGLFIFLSGIFLLAAFGVCYVFWGDNYYFWAFQIMGARRGIAISPDTYGISIVRGIDHILRAWPEIFVGVIGGWLLLRQENRRRIGPIIFAWLVLVASEAFSSGAGWGVIYHFGPGALIGATFMFAALPFIWQRELDNDVVEPPGRRWAKGLLLLASVLAIFTAWHVVPTGDKENPRYFRAETRSPDVNRYVAQIEGEFVGYDPRKVLLDVGSWVYLPSDVLQKDRAVSLGDQPPAGIYENIDETVERVRSRTYSKILVHDFHSQFLLYDWGAWPKSSGFRDALLTNYKEVRIIESPNGYPSPSFQISNAGPVSVFELKN